MLKNRYEMRGEKTVIFVDRPKDGKTYEVLIDTKDLPKVLKCRSIHVDEKGKDRFGNPKLYVRLYDSEGRHVHLHRYLLNPPDNKIIDHLDGNPLNNTQENLLITTLALNNQNRKAQGKLGLRGVDMYKGRYRARAKINGKEYYIGCFDTAEEAAEAAAKFRAEHMPNSKEGREARCKSLSTTEITTAS